jgi:hypothetical protein
MWSCVLTARQEGAWYFDFGGFDRKCAEDILAGRTLSVEFKDSPNYFKWSFGGKIVLMPQAQFILTGGFAQLALSGIARWLLTSQAARQVAQRIRAARLPKKTTPAQVDSAS